MSAFAMDGRILARFRKVCALMGSEHDGERAAAALKATAMLRAAGKSWADVGIGASSAAPADQAHASMMAAFYMTALESEQARSKRMVEQITRLKREVARLKGMWPKVPA